MALAGLGAALLTVVAGREYFLLPRQDRPWAPLHELLSPSGRWGHGLGVAGSALMLANLLYLARRRWARSARWGPLPTWLAFHVAAGSAGVLLVAVHSAGLFHNVIARISLIAAGVVLLTGAVGRWIYGQVPHRADGREAEEGELVAERRAILAELPEALRDKAEGAERRLARHMPPLLVGPRAAALWMPAVPVLALCRGVASLALGAELRRIHGAADGQRIARAASTMVSLRLRSRRLGGFKQLLGTWRGVHRIATFVLLLSLVAHVFTVIWFGSRWRG